MTLNDRLAAYFQAHPNVWIDGMVLAQAGGIYAWRSRCSDLRKRGMVIENVQQRTLDGRCRSLYRYVPSQGQATLWQEQA